VTPVRQLAGGLRHLKKLRDRGVPDAERSKRKKEGEAYSDQVSVAFA
jgi:hypothetical protein